MYIYVYVLYIKLIKTHISVIFYSVDAISNI